MATVAVAATLVAAATGCIGKTGRNDDYVEPGSTDRGPSGQVVPADG